MDSNSNNDNTPAANNYFPYKHNIADWVGFLGLASSIRSATRDIILLENQVPYMVISLLMISLYNIQMRRLLLAWFFKWTTAYDQQARQNIIPGVEQEDPIHLLEACWRVLVMNEDNIASIRAPLNTLASPADNVYTNRSVMNLKTMGIQFHRSDSHFLKDINFRSGFIRGHLLIPFKNISSTTPVMYSNLIAYKVSPGTGTEHVVLCYINLMKSLVQTPEDMQELQKQGIMMNKFANDVDAHCRKRTKTLLVNLQYTNFRTPWSGIGFIAAVLLLFLASVQTYFTAFPKN